MRLRAAKPEPDPRSSGQDKTQSPSATPASRTQWEEEYLRAEFSLQLEEPMLLTDAGSRAAALAPHIGTCLFLRRAQCCVRNIRTPAGK